MGENLIQVNWDTHKQILFGNLTTFRDEQIHTDVTLSCDGNFYPAHKLILTMCSGYFAKAFQYAGNSATIFFLCGIKKETLEALLTFIYNGTVTIPSDEIADMARAGNLLQIQELSQIASVISAKAEEQISSDDVSVQQNGAISRKPMVLLEKEVMDRIIKQSDDQEKSKVEENVNTSTNESDDFVKLNDEDSKDENLFASNQDGNSSDYEFEGWEQSAINKRKAIATSLLSKISEKRAKPLKTCFKCRTQFEYQSDLVEHFTRRHKNMMKKHYCKRCKKIFRFKKSFQKHKELLNCGRKFCKKCSYSSLSFNDFRTHLQGHRNDESSGDIKTINGGETLPSQDSLILNFGDPCKKKRKFSHKALNDALKAISTDFEKFTDVGTCYDEYDLEEYSSSDSSPPNKSQKVHFTCSCCELTFDNLVAFNCHKQEDCKLLECPFCLKVFIKEKKDLLEGHKRNHDFAIKPYTCPYCTFACDQKGVRDHHLERHTRKD